MSMPDGFDADEDGFAPSSERAGIQSVAKELEGDNRHPDHFLDECSEINDEAAEIYKTVRRVDREYNSLVNKSLKNIYVAYAIYESCQEISSAIQKAKTAILEKFGNYKIRKNTHPLVTLCLAYSPNPSVFGQDPKEFRRRAMKDASERAIALRKCLSEGITASEFSNYLNSTSVSSLAREARKRKDKNSTIKKKEFIEHDFRNSSMKDVIKIMITSPKGNKLTINLGFLERLDIRIERSDHVPEVKLSKGPNKLHSLDIASPPRPKKTKS